MAPLGWHIGANGQGARPTDEAFASVIDALVSLASNAGGGGASETDQSLLRDVLLKSLDKGDSAQSMMAQQLQDLREQLHSQQLAMLEERHRTEMAALQASLDRVEKALQNGSRNVIDQLRDVVAMQTSFRALAKEAGLAGPTEQSLYSLGNRGLDIAEGFVRNKPKTLPSPEERGSRRGQAERELLKEAERVAYRKPPGVAV